MESFLLAADARAEDASGATPARPTLGGRAIDANGVNCGLLRCPRCFSRLVSKCGELKELHAPDTSLWVPGQPLPRAEGAPEAFEWTETVHTWWWLVGGMDDVDNLGLSRTVTSPRGELKLAMCCECNYGPVGHQLDGDARLWLCCDLLHQQDASLANDAEDFPLPAGIDLNMLQGLLASGMATIQYHVTFEEQRLGLCLGDVVDGTGGVEVLAFTELDGGAGPAERSGKVQVGDRVSRVNGRSTAGLDYTGVLDLVIEASRPITLHFERKATAQQADGTAAARVTHDQWTGHREGGASAASP